MEETIITTDEGKEAFIKVLNETLGNKELIINPNIHIFDYDSGWEDKSPGTFFLKHVVQTEDITEIIGESTLETGIVSSERRWELWLETEKHTYYIDRVIEDRNEYFLFGKDGDTFFIRVVDRDYPDDVTDDVLTKIK